MVGYAGPLGIDCHLFYPFWDKPPLYGIPNCRALFIYHDILRLKSHHPDQRYPSPQFYSKDCNHPKENQGEGRVVETLSLEDVVRKPWLA